MRRYLLFAVLAGCSDHGFAPVDKFVGDAAARIEVSPLELNFWVGGSTVTDTQSFTIHSIGVAPLLVDELELEQPEGEEPVFVLDTSGLPFNIESGSSVGVPVQFFPVGPGEVTGRVLVRSDDPEQRQVPVSLLGRADTPSLRITPDPHDFGTHRVGCPAEQELRLENVGSAALTIEDCSYSGGVGLEHVPSEGLPIVLAPGAWIHTSVSYDPGMEGVVEGVLSVVSTDPRGVVTAAQQGAGEEAGTGEDVFPVVDDLPVDILLAIDRSASMEDDAARLTAGFDELVGILSAATSGWHLGVVTLDDGCFNGGVLRADTVDLSSVFADAVVVGDDRTVALDEALLQLSDRALSASDGGCNAGFRRDGSLLHVIVVSDEPERSWEEAAAWTWDFWVDRLVAGAGDAGSLQISGVVDSEDCNEGAAGYLEAIAATGGEVHSVCQSDWSASMGSLAEASLGRLRVLSLSAAPVVPSIEVWVDDVTMDSGWVYDADANAVILGGAVDGVELRVTYLLEGECP